MWRRCRRLAVRAALGAGLAGCGAMVLEYQAAVELRKVKTQVELVKAEAEKLDPWPEHVASFKSRKGLLMNIAAVAGDSQRPRPAPWGSAFGLVLGAGGGVEPEALSVRTGGMRLQLRSASTRPVVDLAQSIARSSEFCCVEIRVLAVGPADTIFLVEARSQEGPS